MVIDEEWRVKTERIEEFFEGLPGTVKCGPGFYKNGSCEIRTSALTEHRIGTLSIPNTRVQISGDDTETELIYKKFFHTFISAGG